MVLVHLEILRQAAGATRSTRTAATRPAALSEPAVRPAAPPGTIYFWRTTQ